MGFDDSHATPPFGLLGTFALSLDEFIKILTRRSELTVQADNVSICSGGKRVKSGIALRTLPARPCEQGGFTIPRGE